jgi:transposase
LIWPETLNRSCQSNPHFAKKAVLQNYLTQHNIPFSATDTKNVLYEKIIQKKTAVVYKTDKIANLHGHEVIRTPVRHCELNPIELIWAQVKGFVAKNNTPFRLKDVKELTYAAFGKITKDVWTKAEEHVMNIRPVLCLVIGWIINCPCLSVFCFASSCFLYYLCVIINI